LGELADGVVFTSAGCAAGNAKLQQFNEHFKQASGHLPSSSYEVNGYEIGLLLNAAVGAAQSNNGTAIRDALANLDNFHAITGTITYRGTQRIPVRSVALLRYQGGEARCVKTVTPAAAEIPAPL
jgi:branched-chain amino acid transport system substrate-binding protein